MLYLDLLINCMFRSSTRFTHIVYIFSSYFFYLLPLFNFVFVLMCSLLHFVCSSLKNMMMMMMIDVSLIPGSVFCYSGESHSVFWILL